MGGRGSKKVCSGDFCGLRRLGLYVLGKGLTSKLCPVLWKSPQSKFSEKSGAFVPLRASKPPLALSAAFYGFGAGFSDQIRSLK